MASLPGIFNLQEFTDAGALAESYRLYTYAPGTTTHKAIYTDAAGLVPHTYTSDGLGGLFIPLDARGELPTPPFCAAGGYDFVLKNASGSTVRPARRVVGSSDNGDTLRADLADESSASKNAGLLDFSPSLNYVARTIGAALRDSRVSMMWFITSEVERAAIKAGTSTTDHTATIQAAISLVGPGELHFGDFGWRWNVSATLNLANGGAYNGKARLRAVNSAAFGVMMLATGLTGVTVKDLELDGNKANNGADYGVRFIGGSHNTGRDLYVHDTAQAGGYIDNETGTGFEGGRFINCGQALSVSGGAATDNHGLMIISNTGATKDCYARCVRVVDAFRKGITTYTGNSVGNSIIGLDLSSNIVSGCLTGGIYVANQPGATDQRSVALNDNVAYGNYTNFEIVNTKNVSGGGNVSYGSLAQGVIFQSVNDGAVCGFDISDSGADGLRIVSCGNLSVGTVHVRRSNRSGAVSTPGLNVLDSSFVSFGGGSTIYDETPLQTHCIIEQGTSDNNDFDGITCVGFTAAAYSAVGANSRWRNRSGRNSSVGGAVVPQNTLDVDGGITTRPKVLALVNGANQNVALPTNAGSLIINSPTANYSIGGIAGGHDGRRLRLLNYTGFGMTLNHNDAGSTAANRIILASNANRVIATQGAIEIEYSATVGGWTAV